MKIELPEPELRLVVKALLAVTDQLIITGAKSEAETLRAIIAKIAEQALEQAEAEKAKAVNKFAAQLRKFTEEQDKK